MMTVRRWAVWHPASEIDTSGRHESDPHPGSGPHASSVGDLLAHAARGAQDLGAAPILWPRCPRMSPARQQPISGSLSRRQRHWHRAEAISREPSRRTTRGYGRSWAPSKRQRCGATSMTLRPTCSPVPRHCLGTELMEVVHSFDFFARDMTIDVPITKAEVMPATASRLTPRVTMCCN